jgi:hypothetical protein
MWRIEDSSIRLHWEGRYGYLEIGNSNSHGTRPFYYNNLDDPVDSDK